MGLFTKLQMEQINAAAKRSKELAEAQSKPKGNGKSLNSQIASISEKVREHFKDSQAELISSIDQLHDYISNMITAGIGALDTETTGLDRVNDTDNGIIHSVKAGSLSIKCADSGCDHITDIIMQLIY